MFYLELIGACDCSHIILSMERQPRIKDFDNLLNITKPAVLLNILASKL